MASIFLSYRRADNRDVVDRLHEKLCDAFGESEIFYDQEDIRAAENYEKRMIEAAKNAQILMVLIGSHWQSLVMILHKQDHT